MHVNFSQQLLALYKRLIDVIKQNYQWEKNWTLTIILLTINDCLADNRRIEMHQRQYESS